MMMQRLVNSNQERDRYGHYLHKSHNKFDNVDFSALKAERRYKKGYENAATLMFQPLALEQSIWFDPMRSRF
jgi:hypothetical protein